MELWDNKRRIGDGYLRNDSDKEWIFKSDTNKKNTWKIKQRRNGKYKTVKGKRIKDNSKSFNK